MLVWGCVLSLGNVQMCDGESQKKRNSIRKGENGWRKNGGKKIGRVCKRKEKRLERKIIEGKIKKLRNGGKMHKGKRKTGK